MAQDGSSGITCFFFVNSGLESSLGGNGGYLKHEDYRSYNGEIENCSISEPLSKQEKHVDTLVNFGEMNSDHPHLEFATLMELQRGPMSSAICTTRINWQFVKTGIVQGEFCDALTHGVTVVG